MNQEPRLNIADVTELITVQYPQWQAVSIVANLMIESCWFSVDPEPFDVYSVTVKPEAKVHMPPALGLNDAGQRVDFESWFKGVVSVLGDLSADRKEVFRDYFLRGLFPLESIDQDKADTED